MPTSNASLILQCKTYIAICFPTKLCVYPDDIALSGNIITTAVLTKSFHITSISPYSYSSRANEALQNTLLSIP
jgi:hypothetical protein